MQLDFWGTFANLCGLFVLIMVGYAAAKWKILPEDAGAPLSALLLKITLPCTVFTSLIRPYEDGFLHSILLIVAVGLVLYSLSAAISLGLGRLFGVERGRRGMWALCTTFCNYGFMGFPIILSLFGEKGMAYAAIFSIPFNLLIYSLGIRMICSDREETEGEKMRWSKVLLNNINLCTLAGLLLYFARVSVPDAVLSPLNQLSNLTTPLSMIITGINLSKGKLRALFTDRPVVSASLTRLVLLPLLTLGLLRVIDTVIPFGDPLIIGVMFVTLAMPAPALASALAEGYDLEREFPAKIIFFSSLLSSVTIPLMTLLL